jgi:general secretion pathway protein B
MRNGAVEMSLILDALKKSEQERRRDKGPDLQTIHQPAVIRAPQRSYTLLWIALLLGANAAVVAYWWQQRSTAVATATPIVASPANAAAVAPLKPESTPRLGEQAVAASQSGTSPLLTSQEAAQSTAPSTSQANAGAEYTRITPAGSAIANTSSAPASAMRTEEVDELPDDVRNNLPAMTFSFHVYSSNPQQRTIIINNRRMREGEEVSSGLQLQEITEDGVVLLYAQHRIHIGVLSGW